MTIATTAKPATKHIIITERSISGPDWGHDEIRVFETTSAPENLEENYRGWIKRWIDEGSYYGRDDRFSILGAYEVTDTPDKASLKRGIARAIGMKIAEDKAKEAAKEARWAAEREERERAEFERLSAKFGPAAPAR